MKDSREAKHADLSVAVFSCFQQTALPCLTCFEGTPIECVASENSFWNIENSIWQHMLDLTFLVEKCAIGWYVSRVIGFFFFPLQTLKNSWTRFYCISPFRALLGFLFSGSHLFFVAHWKMNQRGSTCLVLRSFEKLSPLCVTPDQHAGHTYLGARGDVEQSKERNHKTKLSNVCPEYRCLHSVHECKNVLKACSHVIPPEEGMQRRLLATVPYVFLSYLWSRRFYWHAWVW